MSERLVTTYSMWNLFRNCRKAAHWRYVLELIPIERDRHLAFGSLMHDALETWHQSRDLALLKSLGKPGAAYGGTGRGSLRRSSCSASFTTTGAWGC